MVGCFVPLCSSGNDPKFKTHLFRPKPETANEWVNIMKKVRRDVTFDPANDNHRICSLHFKKSELITEDVFLIDGKKVGLPRIRWGLTNGALPTVFDMLPPSVRPNIQKPRRKLTRIQTSESPSKRVCIGRDQNTYNFSVLGAPITTEAAPQVTKKDVLLWWQNTRLTPRWIMDPTVEDTIIFVELGTRNGYAFLEKSITLDFSSPVGKLKASVGGNPIKICDTFLKMQDISDVFNHVTTVRACLGLTGFSLVEKCKAGILKNNTWFSNKCEGVGHNTVCQPCKMLHGTLTTVLTNVGLNKNKKGGESKREKARLSYYKRQSNKLRSKLQTQRMHILQQKSYIRNLNIEQLESQLQSLPIPPQLIDSVIHSVKSAKLKSQKGMRYSASWLLECMLLRMKSPAAYEYLRGSKILPLPHTRTLRNLIAGQRCQFGVNGVAIKAIGTQLKGKPRRDRQGVVIFDEVKLRETVEYNSHTNRFDGYVDFGEENVDLTENQQNKLANHALVLMYRPLNDSWVQPVAAFATRNAASGSAIFKVVMQIISKLEAVGAEVISVVCDGAKPNKSFWKICGVGERDDNGVTNKIAHPCADNRYLHFTCDVPHLFKCIRNHFRKYTFAQFFGGTIDFTQYEILFGHDTSLQYGLRKCPKITRSHIFPNCFEKMSVPLATQLFSRSVATGLHFYRELRAPGLEDSTYTEEFTQIMNDLFDALNTKLPFQGVTLESNHFKTIVAFYDKLLQINTGTSRTKSDKNIWFASNETLLALKITLKSTIDIISYLISTIGFQYVLTAKLNQDCLERFFGIMRAAGGREDHPTVCNFMQLFRLLALYNPVKRAIRGNVRSTEEMHVLVNFERELRSSGQEMKLWRSEKKREIDELILEKLIAADNSDISVFDPAGDGTIFEKNLVYYLAGYMCFRSKKFFDCPDCLASITATNGCQNHDVSYLTDLLNYGSLCYPTNDFFQIVEDWERAVCSVIQDHVPYGDLIISCIQSLSHKRSYVIGCNMEGHRECLFKVLLPFYASMRLHFYAKHLRKTLGKGKATKNKRKESKLVS